MGKIVATLHHHPRNIYDSSCKKVVIDLSAEYSDDHLRSIPSRDHANEPEYEG